jgi:predicted nucleotidyltransferase
MDCDQILSLVQQNQPELDKFGVKSLAIFGSVARGEAKIESDIDMLVALQDPVTFDRYMDVKIFLEDLLEYPVDLVISDVLHPRLKPYVEQDAVYVL